MTRNILEIVNETLSGMQQPKIGTLISDTNATSILMKSLSNQVGNLISIDLNWEKGNKFIEIDIEADFDGISEIELSNIADLSNMESLFIWDTSTQEKVVQVSYDQYIYEKVRDNQLTYKRYCIADGKILFSSPFTSNTTLQLFYKSDGFAKSTDDDECVSLSNEFTTDDDEFLLPEYLLIQGLRWKWYDNKNLPNAPREEKIFIEMMDKYENRDKMNIVIDFGAGTKRTSTQDEGVRFE